jgi:hypothetical protein
MAERIPAECFHPSEFIQDELDARGWTLDDLAMRLADGNPERFGIERLGLDFYFEVGPIEPDLRLGDDAARKIAVIFDGVSSDCFINLERSWLQHVQRA